MIPSPTHRKQQHVATEAERNLAELDTILAASSVGIGFIDTQLRYVRVNDSLAAINGLPATQHAGRSVRDVIGDVAADLIEPMLRRVLETREKIDNIEFEGSPPSTPDQLRVFLASYVPVVTAHDEILGVGAVIVDVTEQKRMERDLRERELGFRSVADNIPQLTWMADETGSIIWFNRRWFDFTGTTFEQTRGWGWDSVHHPDHVERVVEKFRRHLVSGEIWEDTFPLRGADGAYRWFLSRAVPIRDEGGRVVRWFGSNTDVTEQRFMHEAMNLLSSSLDYRDTLQQVARLAIPALGDWCTIDLLDDDEITRVAVSHAEPAKVELAHDLARRYPADPNASAGIPTVIRTGRTEWSPEITDEMLVKATSDPEQLRILRELGLKSYVIAPIIARGRTLGAITFVSAESRRQYTTADIAVIEELGRRSGLAVDNARLFENAQREARVREEILAIVSHDLKNPLNTVHLTATMLLDAPDTPPRTRKHLEAIHRATTRMDNLISDLLDMASFHAGRPAIEQHPEDADSILSEVLETNQPMAREHGLTLVSEARLPGVRLDADRGRLIQVFGNLIDNAIKCGREGERIVIGATQDEAAAVFSITDNGPGIADEELPHIFEPYWSTKRHEKKGTGLGLYICRSIVESHGGRIWVESKLGHGTTFHFTLPLASG